MKVQIVSDLHLEFEMWEMPEQPDERDTVLILAGDICVVEHFEMVEDFFDDVNHRFKQVVMVMGNHEFYGHSDDFRRLHNILWYKLEGYSNIELLYRDFVIIDDVTFIGATLWTNMDRSPTFCQYVRGQMNDFRKIKKVVGNENGRIQRYRIVPEDLMQEFYIDHQFIFDTLQSSSTDKNVVITHHAPSYQSIPDHYKGDVLNPAYCTELFEDIYVAKPTLWCHGHIHNSAEYQIGDTVVVCNPKGYPMEENPVFDPTRIWEI